MGVRSLHIANSRDRFPRSPSCGRSGDDSKPPRQMKNHIPISLKSSRLEQEVMMLAMTRWNRRVLTGKTETTRELKAKFNEQANEPKAPPRPQVYMQSKPIQLSSGRWTVRTTFRYSHTIAVESKNNEPSMSRFSKCLFLLLLGRIGN